MKKFLLLVSLIPCGAFAELQPEPTGVIETLPETWPAHWIIAHDAAFFHMSDGKLIVLDADSDNPAERFKGFMNSAFIGMFIQARTRPEIYIAETFRSRGWRGERTAVVKDYRIARITDWWDAPAAPREIPDALELDPEQYVTGEAISTWNLGKQMYEITQAGTHVCWERDKQMALDIASGARPLAA